MCLEYKQWRALGMRQQAGLGLPSALFLIVVMVLIVAAINQLNEMNATAYGRDWLNMRAFYAAESGAQMAAVYQLSSEPAPSCTSGFISNHGFTQNGLNGCRVSVSCSSQVVSSKNYITLTSTGECGNGGDVSRRMIQIRLLQ